MIGQSEPLVSFYKYRLEITAIALKKINYSNLHIDYVLPFENWFELDKLDNFLNNLPN